MVEKAQSCSESALLFKATHLAYLVVLQSFPGSGDGRNRSGSRL